jgi:hypothetical protein
LLAAAAQTNLQAVLREVERDETSQTADAGRQGLQLVLLQVEGLGRDWLVIELC